MGRFLETLSIYAGPETDFNSWTEGLNVRDCSDARVIDFPLNLIPDNTWGGKDNGGYRGWFRVVTLTKVSLSRTYFAAISRATPPAVALGSKLAFPAA
jgi:hypothetical protein